MKASIIEISFGALFVLIDNNLQQYTKIYKKHFAI